MPQLAMVAIALGSAVSSYSQQNSATKSAKSAADTQMRMNVESQDQLVAKETAAKDELAKSQQTADAQAKATVNQKKMAFAQNQTIYTSPLGISGQADTAKKVLLGS
jgi:hypothetical protein